MCVCGRACARLVGTKRACPVLLCRELSRFITTGRLHCKIDKVDGIVETTRPDSKNAQYQEMLKCGDALLNRVSKLSRIINL